jgi:hypothetical protein
VALHLPLSRLPLPQHLLLLPQLRLLHWWSTFCRFSESQHKVHYSQKHSPTDRTLAEAKALMTSSGRGAASSAALASAAAASAAAATPVACTPSMTRPSIDD